MAIPPFKISVLCFTYNQVRYVNDAMNGFCLQQTDFPFICIIIDDASTDGEPDLIQTYLNKHFILDDKSAVCKDETDDYISILVQHKTNKNCYFLVFFLKYNHYQIKKNKEPYYKQYIDSVKYIAINEGDDYWLDPLKLQKQYDFMESHPNNTLCQHSALILYDNGSTIERRLINYSTEKCPHGELILSGPGITCSFFLRKEMIDIHPYWMENLSIGDMPLVLVCLAKGDIGYIDEIMSVYRALTPGSWTSKMRSDIKKRRIHSSQVLNMYRQYDKWTDHKFHPIIKKKMGIIYKSIVLTELAHLKAKIVKK